MKTIRLKSKLSICKTIKLIVKLGLSLLVVEAIEMAYADNLAPTPNEQAVVNGLQKPKFNDYDVNGPCQNNRDAFAYMRAYNIWNDPKYKKMFLLWGMHHAGARAVTNDLRCADLQLIAKLWQSAVNSPITGKLKASETAGFAISVNQLEKKTLQQGMASNRIGQAPLSNVPGSGFSSSQSSNSVAAIRVNDIELGSSYEQVMPKLSSMLCHQEGNDILCSKESKCENQVQRPKTFEERWMNASTIEEGLGYQDAARFNRDLQNCETQFQATAKGRSELSFLGVPIEGTRLSFSANKLTRLRIATTSPPSTRRLTGSRLAQIGNQGNTKDKLHQSLTMQYGNPKIEVIRTTTTWTEQNCYGYNCTTIPKSDWSDHNKYTWRTKNLQIEEEGLIFQFDLIN